MVHAESGELRQVGSACLRDFVGGHDPERACRCAEHLALARAELKRAGTPVLARPSANRSEPALEEFAAHAALVVRAHGFTSREQARRTSRPASADEALRSLREEPEAPDRADRALAAGALRWARALLATKPELSRFERDALAAVSNETGLTRRARGLVCALIAFYRQRRARSRHLAYPGARIEVTVLVERVVAQHSERHGIVRRCELIDAEANRLVWWQTQGDALRGGEVVTLIGRVQRHTRFGATVTVSATAAERSLRCDGGLRRSIRYLTDDPLAIREETRHDRTGTCDPIRQRRRRRKPVRRGRPRAASRTARTDTHRGRSKASPGPRPGHSGRQTVGAGDPRSGCRPVHPPEPEGSVGCPRARKPSCGRRTPAPPRCCGD